MFAIVAVSNTGDSAEFFTWPLPLQLPNGGRTGYVPLTINSAHLLTENDDAFHAKIEAVRAAKQTIDAAYFIYSDDESSSLFSRELIAAAQRGVQVRLLVDLWSNYKYLDLFEAMQLEGSKGNGSLEVRFYNRPTTNMVVDAAYATSPCPTADKSGCAQWKDAQIDSILTKPPIVQLFASNNLADSGFGNAGLLFSGIYAQNYDLASFALLRGQTPEIDAVQISTDAPTQESLDKALAGVRLFWSAYAGHGLRRVVANVKLGLARAIYGAQINPIYDVIKSYLPIERAEFPDSARDWAHLQDFLHHKLLLVDRQRMIIGGRNIENAYHMHPNPFTGARRVFRDTDIDINLADGGDAVGSSFELLWTYDEMVATPEEIRAVAPNDFLANLETFRKARDLCKAGMDDAAVEACVLRVFYATASTTSQRIDSSIAKMAGAAKRYEDAYHASAPAGAFPVDSGASIVYLENLPFVTNQAGERMRVYDPKSGAEVEGGKMIEAHVADALEGVCATATPQAPKRVIINTAYFLLPSRLLRQLGRMLVGEQDCSNVDVVILTNSRETTDTGVENQVDSHVLAALGQFVAMHRNQAHAASFHYYEYQHPVGAPLITAHSKTWVIGDEFVVGSANADLRSFLVDSQNVAVITNAPKLLNEYLALIDMIRADKHHVKDMTEAYVPSTRESVIRGDLSRLRLIATKLGILPHISVGWRQAAAILFRRLTNEAYALTLRILEGGSGSRTAEETFDRKFKAI